MHLRRVALEMNPSRVELIPQNENMRERKDSWTRMKTWQNKRQQQKGAIKSGFEFLQSQPAFLCLIDTWLNNSQFEGENKVISRFITIEIQRAASKKYRAGGEREKWMLKQFSTTFFQFITFKGRCGERQRDRTVKNPSEALIYYSNKTLFPL